MSATLVGDLQCSVLCVDLDGTLIKTDILYESLLRLVRSRPAVLFRLPLWLARGKYYLKREITRRLSGAWDLSSLPRQPEVEEFIADAIGAGKKVELISASAHEIICNDPTLCKTFSAIVGSSDGLNLKGEAKAKFLQKRHPQGFAYVGNSAADLPVWRVAAARFAVNISPSLRRQAAREGITLVELAQRKPALPALLRSMRLHQWLKNMLIFVPLLFVGPSATLKDIEVFLSAFLLFGLATSGTYLINDILDVDADRRHPRKMRRPIASGDLSLPLAAATAFVFVGLALAGAAWLNVAFALALSCYLSVTLAYSLILKRIPLIDVLVLAGLFTLRVVAGKTLVDLPPSQWLLLFSIFFFFSLALMKREVELNVVAQAGGAALEGRGYSIQDRPLILGFGASSGVASLVVFALFVSSVTEQLSSTYSAPELLWGAMAFLSYWILRMWLLTVRGLMNDDPILYAARERASWILAGLITVFVLAAELVRI